MNNTDSNKLEINQEAFDEALDVTTPEDERPYITDEQYKTLALLRDRQHLLKSRGYDLRTFAEDLTKQISDAKANFAEQIAAAEGQHTAALAQLEEVKGELDETTVELRDKFTEFMAPFGLESANVQVEESEPHYVTVIQQPQS